MFFFILNFSGLQLQALEQLSEDLRNNHISDMKFISQSKEIKEKNLKSLGKRNEEE